MLYGKVCITKENYENSIYNTKDWQSKNKVVDWKVDNENGVIEFLVVLECDIDKSKKEQWGIM
jgi:hypothetical protein